MPLQRLKDGLVYLNYKAEEEEAISVVERALLTVINKIFKGSDDV